MIKLYKLIRSFIFTPPIKCSKCGFIGQPVSGRCESCGATLDGFSLD